jgi:hypothetical protein
MKILTFILAVLVGLIAAWLFMQVLPTPAAVTLAIIIAVIEFAGSLKNGAGAGLRAVLALDLVLLAWPLTALALTYAGVSDRPTRIALSAAAAAAAGLAATRHGSGMDSRRLWSIVAALAIPMYAMAHTLILPVLDPPAMASACLAAGVAILVARAGNVWPREHRDLMIWAAGAAGVAGLICGLVWLV